MENKQKDEIIIILKELITYCESINKISMRDVYQSIKNDLSNGISVDAKWACRYFCGYLLKADLPDYEYIRVEK